MFLKHVYLGTIMLPLVQATEKAVHRVMFCGFVKVVPFSLGGSLRSCAVDGQLFCRIGALRSLNGQGGFFKTLRVMKQHPGGVCNSFNGLLRYQRCPFVGLQFQTSTFSVCGGFAAIQQLVAYLERRVETDPRLQG